MTNGTNYKKFNYKNITVEVFNGYDGDQIFLSNGYSARTIRNQGERIAKERIDDLQPEAATSAFEVGKTYQYAFPGDRNLKTNVKIESRTAKTIKTDKGTFRIYIYDGRETVKPEGSYSMCPILNADKIVEDIQSKYTTPELQNTYDNLKNLSDRSLCRLWMGTNNSDNVDLVLANLLNERNIKSPTETAA